MKLIFGIIFWGSIKLFKNFIYLYLINIPTLKAYHDTIFVN